RPPVNNPVDGPVDKSEIMVAMEIEAPGRPLRRIERAVPAPGPNESSIAVSACGVCRTDLHVLDGEVKARYPVIPGHEIVGRVMASGEGVTGFAVGQRVGVPWLGHTCGTCPYCAGGRENSCDAPAFTGATRDGGYATHTVADAHFCFASPDCFSDVEAAPSSCAGSIGWRALRSAGEGKVIGLYGFGAAAHISAQVAVWQGRTVHGFTKPDDAAGQAFAHSLGCVWAGGADGMPPEPRDAASVFAPVGDSVPQASKAVRKGGRVISSVANSTREDGVSFFAVAEQAGIRSVTESFPSAQADEALARSRSGASQGAALSSPEGCSALTLSSPAGADGMRGVADK
ncbi:hypothetical protein OY671_007874, partial [Metschnikowia pulcherrima]